VASPAIQLLKRYDTPRAFTRFRGLYFSAACSASGTQEISTQTVQVEVEGGSSLILCAQCRSKPPQEPNTALHQTTSSSSQSLSAMSAAAHAVSQKDSKHNNV